MLLSDFPFWRRTFGPFAWFVDARDPGAMTEAVRAAQGDTEGRRRKGREGRKVVRERYSWESESARLVDLYRALEK
jgi:glycosyltransferase involved in cell wall biosynthesis